MEIQYGVYDFLFMDDIVRVDINYVKYYRDRRKAS